MKVLRGFVTSILALLLFALLFVFGAVFTLDRTVLNADFVTSEINKLDMPALAGELVSPQIPAEYRFAADEINGIIAELQPWIKEQISTIVHTGYDYLLDRSDSMKVVIPLEPAKEKIKTKLREAFLKSPPAEYRGMSPAMLEQTFNQFYQDFSQSVTSTFEIDESMIPQEFGSIVQEIRHYAGYYQVTYWGLVAIIIIFMLLIFALNGEVRGTARSLGITFILYGAIVFALVWAMEKYGAPYLKFAELPQALQSWILQVSHDSLGPIQIFNIGLLAAGIVLLVISFVYPKPVED